MIDNRPDPFREKITAEIKANGPGTAKQIATAINDDANAVIRKLIGMCKDGDVSSLSSQRYQVFGLTAKGGAWDG